MDNDQPQDQGGTSQEPAAQGAVDFEKFKKDLVDSLTPVFSQEMDNRFKGFQKIIAKRDERLGSLEQTIEELKTSTLSEAEREQLLERRERQENQALREEASLLDMLDDYPEEVPLFRRIIKAPDRAAQLEILRSLRTGAQASTPNTNEQERQEPAPQTSPVDPNQPPAVPRPASMEKAFEKDPSMVEKLLRGASRWRDQES